MHDELIPFTVYKDFMNVESWIFKNKILNLLINHIKFSYFLSSFWND